MKRPTQIALLFLMIASTTITSCDAIAGIFNAGMGVGIFAVIAILMLIIFVISKVFKGKNT